MEEFERFLKEKGKSYLTIKNYSSQINKFLQRNENIEKILNFMQEMKNPLRKYAVLYYLKFLQEVKKQDVGKIIEEVQKVKIASPERKEVKTLLYDDVVKLVHYLQEEDKELALIVMIVFDTGARIRAILKLKKKDCMLEGENMRLFLFEKKGRIIDRYLTKETTVHFLNYFNLNNIEDEQYLFFGKNKITAEEINKKYYELWTKLKNYSRKIFNVGVSFHWLRRGSAIYIYRKTGKDIVAASEHLGHKHPGVTLTYLKLEAEKAKEIVKKDKREW